MDLFSHDSSLGLFLLALPSYILVLGFRLVSLPLMFAFQLTQMLFELGHDRWWRPHYGRLSIGLSLYILEQPGFSARRQAAARRYLCLDSPVITMRLAKHADALLQRSDPRLRQYYIWFWQLYNDDWKAISSVDRETFSVLQVRLALSNIDIESAERWTSIVSRD